MASWPPLQGVLGVCHCASAAVLTSGSEFRHPTCGGGGLNPSSA